MSGLVITVKKSTSFHPDAGLGLSASQTIEADEVVRYCYGSLVYAALTKTQDKTRIHGSGVAQGSVKCFRSRRMSYRTRSRLGMGWTVRYG